MKSLEQIEEAIASLIIDVFSISPSSKKQRQQVIKAARLLNKAKVTIQKTQ